MILSCTSNGPQAGPNFSSSLYVTAGQSYAPDVGTVAWVRLYTCAGLTDQVCGPVLFAVRENAINHKSAEVTASCPKNFFSRFSGVVFAFRVQTQSQSSEEIKYQSQTYCNDVRCVLPLFCHLVTPGCENRSPRCNRAASTS